MQAHENPLTFLLYHEDARHLLFLLEEGGTVGYERARQQLGAHPQSFKRLTQRLSQWAILQYRAPQDGEFEDNRISVVLDLGPKADTILKTIQDVQATVRQHEAELGSWSDPLLA